MIRPQSKNYLAVLARIEHNKKRFEAALAAMQGLCANPNLRDNLIIAETSVRLADVLLEIIESENSPDAEKEGDK